MSWDEAMKVATGHAGYVVLADVYHQEAMSRLMSYIDQKKLTHDFISWDERRK